MSVSLSAERDRIQRQVEELEQCLSATHTELELLSSETDDESDCDNVEEEAEQSAAGLLAQREKIQKEIQNLENVLGPHSPICVSDDDSSSSISSDESELGLSLTVESCLQMNLVYQQVVQETLDELETLLTQNQRQQKEVLSQLSGPIKESPREQRVPSSPQLPVNMFLGRFLKPYFKDKLTGLGPPANEETKEKTSRMTGCLDNKKLKVKRWESWQKTLLIHSVSRDGLRRLIQPKLSKVDYLSQKMSAAEERDRQQLREQIDGLEREIELLRGKKEEELIGDRYEEHDWQKISNIDFEGTRDAEDIRSFWQNFLHPSINKSQWSQEEVQQLKEVSRRHGERYWETIATELGTGRTAFLCLQTFQRFVSDSLRHGNWTPTEDALLRELVDKMRIGNFIPYTQMSYFMEGRGPSQLIYRWNQVLDPSLKKGAWTQEEDQLLMRAVSLYGEKDWWKIRMEVPGRHDGACRDRYYDCLKVDTKRGPFDQQEKELLLKLVEKHGVGRWAKIAAEIPHRYDAQCLREWRKLSKPALPPAQKSEKARKPGATHGGAKKRRQSKKVNPARKKIRRRQMKLKEEEEEEEIREEEEIVVEYMDSDEEGKKKKKTKKIKEAVEVLPIAEVEKEEEAYSFPPMQEWIPSKKAQSFTFLNFRPVELPSSSDGHKGNPVRSTILGEFGRSVIIGPPPTELPWEKRHSSSKLMMVSPDQLRAHLFRQVEKSNSLNSGPRQKVQTSKLLGRALDKALEYQLQAAVTPWIGNLLIPAKSRLTAADTLRERGEKRQLTSTSIFQLFLQTMNVDSVGCKKMIEKRKSGVLFVTPPPDPFSVRLKNPMTIAGMLQRRRMKEELQEFKLQPSLILEQLQPQDEHGQQLRACPPSHPRPPVTSSLNHHGILLQMPPNMCPQMSPMSFPQAIFIPQPVPQPPAASIRHLPPSSMATPPPCPSVAVTSPVPAPPVPPRQSLPPNSAVQVPPNTTSPSSAGHLSADLVVPLLPLPDQHVSTGSTLPNQDAVPSSSSSPSRPRPAPTPSSSSQRGGRRQKVVETGGSSENGLVVGGADHDVGGARTCLDGAGGEMRNGKRTRKLTAKAKALQEAAVFKAESKRKAILSPRNKVPILNTNSAPHAPHSPQTAVCAPLQQKGTAPVQLVPQTPLPAAPQSPPPATVVSSPLLPSAPPLRLPPVSVNSSTAAYSDTTVSSTQNLSVAPPPSILTNQHTASSTSGPPVGFSNDHDYSFWNFGSTSSRDGPASGLSSPPSSCKYGHTPKKTSKAPPRGRKRVRVTSSQDDQCVGGAGDTVGVVGDAVGGASTGVVVEGKRIRKPSQRARAFQEAAQDKAPRKKRSRTSGPKKEIVVQKQQQTLLPEMSPGQSMWMMTAGGLVQLAQAPPQGLQLTFVPSFPFPALSENMSDCQPAAAPLRLPAASLPSLAAKPTTASSPVDLQPLPDPPTCTSKAPPPAFILHPLPIPTSPPRRAPQPPPKLYLPHKSTVRADPAVPPPLRTEPLQFDPSLIFLESQAAMCDWLSGQGGVLVPGAGVALPYLPPFISSLTTFSALLCAKKSLTKTSLHLLCQGSEPRHPRPKPKPDSSTMEPPSQTPDLPDSTSDLRPGASVSSDHLQEEAEEAELVAAVRHLVAERFSGNSAYQLLKARFLSCFTVPALLATMQPIAGKTGTPQANRDEEVEEEQEEEEEEEEELKKIKERAGQRKAERSLLLCAESGAPANHFSGIIQTNTATDLTGLDQ